MCLIPTSSTLVVSNYFSCSYVFLLVLGRGPHLSPHQRVPRQDLRGVMCSLGQRGSPRDGSEVHFCLGEALRFPLLDAFSIKRERETEAPVITTL